MAHAVALRGGFNVLQALVLSERLKVISTAFDQCRSMRYQQRMKQEQQLFQRRQAINRQAHIHVLLLYDR